MRILMIIPILLLFPVPPVAGETFRGFHFLDNKIEDIFGPENGYATKTLEIPVPDQMSFCLWTFADFNRFNDQIPIIEFYRLGETIPPFIALMYRDDGNSGRINSDGLATWPIRNFTSFERKWNHLCASVDIVENTIELFLNGKSDFQKSTRS
ncbi:uncharacterized protein LOC111717385, partial [Eurytemora carolleeae]|uniref:uncharacterized protein LOC111717385 n=1 Tax=Eurytemora carolleeae TaxID=1294199 RepID=UPI000C7658A9